jgi:cytochrome c5
MSDSHDQAGAAAVASHDPHGADEGPHEGPIRTPRQLIVAVAASFIVPIIVILLLVNFVDFGNREGAGSTGLQAEAVTQRIKPIGAVEIRDASDVTALRTGEQVYKGQCSACHAIGAVGSPKFGDAAAWAPRIATGYESLLNSALKGKGAMTAQGGGDYSDIEVGRGVVYMANQAGANFAVPQPAAAAAAASAASAP